MVSRFAFVMTAYGLNPYLIASFSSGLACENAKSQILAAAREQALPGTTTYALAPRSLKCHARAGGRRCSAAGGGGHADRAAQGSRRR